VAYETSIFLRLLAVCVYLLAPKGQAKHTGILTYFQTKINEKRKKTQEEVRGLENGCLGYQVNRKSGGRLSGKQDIRIIPIFDAGYLLVRSELK